MKKLFAILLLLPLLFEIAVAQVLRKPIPDKLVVLSFDDAVLSHATIVAPLLKKYGFGATFFVCEFLKPPFSDKTRYMSWEQIKQLSRMGFEIGNHTQNHSHVNKLDKAHFIAELEYIENKCKEYHIPKPVSFAYPGYDTSPKAMVVLKEKGYLFARAGWDRAYNPTTDHPYLIPGFTTLQNNSTTIYDALKQAKDGKVIVLTIHGVPDSAHVWVNTPPELFEGYLKYMHDNHYKVIAMRDLKRYIDVNKAFELTPIFKQ
ncbi:polysaccharide deacetylase family protein [Mucilaginibacter paludis]|uniref:Polysaccharide deacetylase n=1 Tax=Mucilaginibacter paludis DSM 18603 TaxID=714943 RepID=H1YCP9_9SPHI|nr:polysaccharide deacetylase family protein [Mucilaginibacter paludis]EHQ24236.1 polysaccharide deacetylase [Mucilaginibacter paludis DSM 18603]